MQMFLNSLDSKKANLDEKIYCIEIGHIVEDLLIILHYAEELEND